CGRSCHASPRSPIFGRRKQEQIAKVPTPPSRPKARKSRPVRRQRNCLLRARPGDKEVGNRQPSTVTEAHMKRREFIEKAGLSSAALASLSAFSRPPKDQQAADQSEDHDHGHGKREDMDGPLSSATVSFGQWNADPLIDPTLDRFPNNSPRNNNNHQ